MVESLWNITPLLSRKVLNSAAVNWIPLSETMVVGTPYVANNSSRILIVASVVGDFDFKPLTISIDDD